jgi:hypothetical protein
MRIKLKDNFEFGTQLNNVEVPAALRKKISSGVDFFDTALGGQGFIGRNKLLDAVGGSLHMIGHHPIKVVFVESHRHGRGVLELVQ